MADYIQISAQISEATRARLDSYARETGLKASTIGLYSDSLAPSGEASSYLGMMRHNTQALAAAVQGR